MQKTRNKNKELKYQVRAVQNEIEHITDFAEIASYGVMSTPALVFNGEVISYGKVLTADEVKALLSK